MSEEKSPYDRNRDGGCHMRPSRVLRKIRNGGVAGCLKINSSSSDPRIVEVAAMTGINAIWLCTEHVPTNYGDLENQVRAARLHDVDAIVRVPRGSYSDYIRGFEMDAAGIMVPHVMDIEDAKNVVRITKFPPVGRRAVDGGNVDGGFCLVNLLEYLETANTERFNILQIEDPEAVPYLEQIAELPGVDGLLFGAGDFSVAIGKPGEMDAPEIEDVRKKVAVAARRHNKLAGALGTPATLPHLVDLGYNFINLGADVIAWAEYAAERVAALSQFN